MKFWQRFHMVLAFVAMLMFIAPVAQAKGGPAKGGAAHSMPKAPKSPVPKR